MTFAAQEGGERDHVGGKKKKQRPLPSATHDPSANVKRAEQ